MPLIETRGTASSRAYGQFARQVAANYIEDVFSTYLYTGNSSGSTTQTITNGIDLSTKGGLVWIKSRSDAVDHNLYDTTRGVKTYLASNSTSQNSTWFDGGVSAFNTTGFTVGPQTSNSNVLNQNYVSWTFRKQEKFFDIVTYTGNGSSSRLINHSLGSVPGLVIIKSTTQASNWPVMFAPTSGLAYGFSGALAGGGLQSTGEGYSLGNVTGVSTATQFRVGSAYWGGFSETNDLNVGYIAYVFANNGGGFGASGTENAITCGSYVGNGSTTGPVITLGYEPQWLLIKNRETGTTDEWVIVDTMRGLPLNGPANRLYPNNANSEASNNPYINISATGFQPVVTSSQINTSGSNYIYMAIRRGPMRTPTSGTSVFSPNAYSASGSSLTVSTGFPVDTVFPLYRNANSNKFVIDRLRGSTATNSQLLWTNATNAENATGSYGLNMASNTSFTDTGVAAPAAYNSVYWAFRRAAGFFDVVCWTGDGTSSRNISPSLGIAPEVIITKNRGGTIPSVVDWIVGSNYLINLGSSFQPVAKLNALDAAFNNNAYFAGDPTATTFSVNVLRNNSSTNYVAYLFASCPGVSKVGFYNGTGTTNPIDCGFTAGARFVLIKRANSTGNWYVWDSARGIVAGNDPYFYLNSISAELTASDLINPYSAGFEIPTAGTSELNASGGRYFFLAIA